jgi:ankyrin repeat protein
VNAPGGPQGRTALHYAAAVGHAQVVAVLLAAGAARALRDDTGQTARDLAAERGRPVTGL